MSQLLQLTSEGHGPYHLAHIASGSFIHKSHRTIANKEAVTGVEVLAMSSPQGSMQRELAKMPIVQFLSGRGLTAYHTLLAQGLTSNYHISRC